MNAIKSNSIYLSPVGLVINDCISLLNEIPNCEISFVYRIANQAAHCLARVSGSIFSLCIWGIQAPLFLVDVLQYDAQ